MEPRRNLDVRSHVLTNINRDEMHFVVCTDCDYMHAVFIDDKCGCRNDEGVLGLWEMEGDLSVHAGEQGAVTIVDLHFGQHSAGICIDRCRSSGDRRAILSARPLISRNYRLLPGSSPNPATLPPPTLTPPPPHF